MLKSNYYSKEFYWIKKKKKCLWKNKSSVPGPIAAVDVFVSLPPPSHIPFLK